MLKTKKSSKSLLCRVLAVVMVLQMVLAAPIVAQGADSTSLDPMFNPDYSELIGRSDRTYTGMISSGTQGMIIGNGRFGGPVWQKSASTLEMQLNHTDAFMFNDASNSTTDASGALAQLTVDFGGTAFTKDTAQRLSLYEGKLNLDSEAIDIEIITKEDSDTIAVKITDDRDNPQPINIDLLMLRNPTVNSGARSAISSYTVDEENKVMALKQVFSETSPTEFRENDFYCSTAVAVKTYGREGTFSSVNNRTERLSLPAQKGSFVIMIGGDATMDAEEDAQAAAIAQAVEAPSYDEIKAASQAWWSDFWSKSYVYIPSQLQFEQRRNYYMYLAAISNRGDYPSKYNGGIWIGEGDTRSWGGWYWNWNQDSLYQPLYEANHEDLMGAYYNLRNSAYDQYTVAAKQLWHSDGIFVGETSGVLGWETLPDDVAEALYEYYAGGEKAQILDTYGSSKNSYITPWNWKITFSGTSVSWVSHIMVATQETAEHFWNNYCYTKDVDFLRDQAYKFIKGAAEFYRNYYGFKKDEDGKYHFYRTNLHEHIGGGKDVIDDVSLAYGTFAAAIEASKILGVDEDLRAEWQERLDNLTDFPKNTDPDPIGWAAEHSNGKVVFAQGLKPNYYLRGTEGTESPQFKMLEKYDVLNMETRDQGLDEGNWEIAMNTYFASPGYTNQYKKQQEDKNGSSRFLEDVAKLGRGDDLAIMFPAQYKAFHDTPNWMWNEGDYYSAEGHGTFAAAIQLALNQSIAPYTGGDPVIRVFPAWPEAWDAKYKLAAKDGFLVSSSMEKGEIEYVQIESELGEICRIRNPWDGDIDVYRNGVKSETLKGKNNDLMEFDTDAGDMIVLVAKGAKPDDFRSEEVEVVDYAIFNDDESNMNYSGEWKVDTNNISYRGDAHYAENDGASVEYMFYGAGIDVLTDVGPDMGKLDVYIDGKKDQTVDCSSDRVKGQALVYRNKSLTYSAHTIKLVKAGGSKVAVDALKVWSVGEAADEDGEIEIINDNDSRVQHIGTWTYQGRRTSEGDYMNDGHVTSTVGSYVELTFTGSGIAFLTEMNNDTPEIEVFVDGESKGRFDTYKTGGRQSQTPIYQNTELPYGEHTIQVYKVANGNGGASGAQYLISDAFKVWLTDPSTQEEDEETNEFYVSPNGSDENDGKSAETPFATLEKARDAVREINGDMQEDITVYLMDGTWELDETLKFDERDSGTNGFDIHYVAAEGAKPIISGGKTIDAEWEVAEDVDWLQNGLVAYKTHFERDDKIRAIYVNDQRASMTRKTARPKRSAGTYSVTKGQADWAWTSGSKAAGNVFASDFLPANTRNPQNIELESGSTWVKAVVCAASLEDIGNNETQVNFQMPYAAMAQTLSWNCNYNPTGNNDVTNVFEWLSKEGEFYFDQAGSTLYYIPRAGEDMDTAEVIVPVLDQLVNVTGSKPLDTYAENIVFDGIKFAYTDWNLYEVEGSHGNATVQAATVITKYADGNWHNDMYRAYDVPTAAIQVNTAKNIQFINGEISNTGYLGIHLENDVWYCDVSGNYVGQTGGAGIVIGHPQHVYENDPDDYKVGSNGATADKEKFARGTESVPKHINIMNNYLLENCYFFPGNAPITSFFTYDMKVQHNFVYKCSYSGMSIGWGWCEFDGTSSSKLPGKPTTTSRANDVSYNRIEEICSILQDAGGIYTLGQQGNDDWSDVTVMNNNFINCKRVNQGGSTMVNGFHPDEGSAFILMDGNVVTNSIRNVYELNNWQRKHDVIVTNAFSNTNKSETTAPNCTLDMYVNANYTWPILGYSTVLNSGLEDGFVDMVGKDVIADTEYELASNVKMEAGLTLPRRGLLSAEDTVWLAPQGTTEFVEGPTMTKAAGNEKSIVLPETEGSYKLYIVYADGTVSKASQNTAYVGEAKPATNIVDGMEYSVSKSNPLVIELNTETYKFTLNGEAVKDGDKITTEGEWELVATMIGSTDAPKTIKFSTYISEANKLLPKNVTVKSGEEVKLAANLNDPSLKIWLASQSASAFEESDTMSCAAGDKDVIAAPQAEGVYDLAVVNDIGEILSRSDCTVTVSNAEVPVSDYIMNFAADKGIVETDGAVSGWENTANADEVLTQATASAMPTLQTNEYGKPYLNFNGKQRLVYEGVNFNGKSEMTVIVMSRNNSNSYASASYNQGNGDRFAPIYINEASGWSGLYVTPYQSWIGVRFGTTKSNCYIKTQRGKTNTDVSVVTAVKNGSTESIYDDGAKLYTKTNVSGTSLAGLGNKLSVGCSYSNGDTYFIGDIFEIFIYDRALSDEEVATMTDYLTAKYLNAGCAHEYAAVVTEPTCTEEGFTTYTCSKCGDSYVDNKVAALGHDYVDGKCTRCGEEQPPMATFFVSPDGSDENDGTSADKAFASLEKVRDAVREINSDMTGDIVVYLGDGTWELDETLKFDERDSGTNGYVVRYAAAEGAKPVISGGKTLSTKWEVAENIDWLADGLVAYKTRFVRDDKIRAIYVNDQRASMTRKTARPKRSAGTYSVTKGQADWAWTSGSKAAGNVFASDFLPANTRNPQNIELESGSTWVKAVVCAASLEDIGNNETQVNFQMPYAAMAQTLSWNCNYNPTGNNDVTNVFEWLSKEGEFYFDQADSTLYYIPRAGEDMDTAEVVVPVLDQLVNITGSKPLDTYAENIVFDGIKFAYTDWNLYEVEGSHGNATVQAATVITKYADGNWHNDMYRAYDVPTAAIQVNTAKNIKFINGNISNTGYLGIHLENDVWDCDVTGNYVGQTGGAGIVIGHPQHVYENDTDDYRVGNGATADKEKFARGTESVPKHINITNNYLLENCYFFPGNAPITSFYTYDMKVLNNFVYKCSYSGMSIGWGWCEFDGTSSSKLPGKPTTTSRANTVSNNRIEEICSILQDAGGIYTLGQQGNDDWTDVTVMNNNFINAQRTNTAASGSRMVNGFHPDEGSAYILMDGNVVTNTIRNVYELNNWQRKHDVIVTNAFSNTNKSETTAPNCTLDMYVDANYTWPILGYTTVLNSGLEDAYVGMVSKDVIGDTEYELASNVKMEAGLTLPRRGLLSAEDTVWLAPQGTTEFVEGPTMTKAAGNEKSIVLPETEGTYKLYIVYADGTVSKASQNTAYVGAAKPATNIVDGMEYSVSKNNPLVLELNDDTYKFTLNGEAVKNGEKIITEGEWELVITMIGSTDAPQTIKFSTYISEANKLLPKNVTVKSGEAIQLAANLNDPSLKIWIASQSASAFEEGKTMTCVAGDKDVIAAPKEAGVYDLAVVNENGEILSRSDAIVKVLASGASVVTIDFKKEEDADKYDIVNKTSAEIVEDKGLYLITTKDGFETANGQLSGDAATNPKDLVIVPVEGNWTATLKFDFDPANASNGYYQFFGFYAMEDYNNAAGIRSGDGALQNFLRVDGNITADSADLNSGPGLSQKGTYWQRIVKEGDTYTCYRSADGEDFTEIFKYEATGIEAESIAIDAYTGMTAGYTFYLDTLTIEGEDNSLPNIDFKDPADAEKYDIINKDVSEIDEEKGLYMITTKDGFETAGGQLKGDAATTPKDLVLVPVGGDWAATLKFDFDKANASNGYYQFFGFYAMEDYNNAVGIRGGDGAMQDFLRVDGNITADTDLKSGPGLSENGTYWFRIEKEGTTYTCLRSSDGEDFTEMFKFADTGIEAENIAIDAYTGMTAGYTFYLDTLTFEGGTKPAGCKHDYAAVVTEPTCTEAGYTTYTCSKCGDSYVADEVAALGHDYKAGEKVEPTCTEDGYTTYTCARCEDSYKGDVVKALGHDYKAVVTEPTCTEDGYTTYTCARCEDSYVADEVKALGHDYKAVVTEPTCTEAGYTTYTCTRCEDSYVGDEVEALGHDYVDGKCTRCGEIDPDYEAEDIEEALKAAQAAAKAAQEAQKAAEAAKKAAEEAAAAAAADSSAAEAAKKAAEEAEKKAEAAQAAAEAAKKAAEAADADAAIKAAEAAASAAESAASAAEAAKAQAAAAQAQAKAEEAQKAAEEAQKKADEAAQKGEAAADEAAAAQKAAEEAKKAAEDAKAAADLSADAADKANAEAAEAAAKAAADAAKIADALKEVAAAQADVAAALEKAAKDAENAAKERAAAEAAQKAAEEAAKAAKEAELNAAKYNALTKAALAAAGAEDVDPAVFEAGIKAIEDAEDVAAVEAAVADLLEKLESAEPECPSADFIDAPAKGNWAHEGIDFCVANDYMNGVSANVFSPEGTVTRAQLVTILYRVAGSPETEFKGTFSDVADGQWYSAAIEWAAANGVVNGVGEGKFVPDGEITREQIATLLFRYSKADKVEGNLKAFPDGDTAGDFAVDGLVWAVSEGLITGVKNGDVTTLAPKDNATRAQIAAIIMRFLDGSFDCK